MGISQREWWNHVKREHAWLEEEWLSAGRDIPADSSPASARMPQWFDSTAYRSIGGGDVFRHFQWGINNDWLTKSCQECIGIKHKQRISCKRGETDLLGC